MQSGLVRVPNQHENFSPKKESTYLLFTVHLFINLLHLCIKYVQIQSILWLKNEEILINDKQREGGGDDVIIHQKKSVPYNTLRVSVEILEGNTAPNNIHQLLHIVNLRTSQ